VEGRLSRAIHRFSQSLRRALVLIEAWIDFPEEELPVRESLDLEFQLSEIIKEIDVLLDTFQTGRAFIEGVSILLIGRPNSGKSSLLNALLGEERAIVTEIPGTTRDTLEEGLTIGGLPVRLVDTAGFRHSEDRVEMEGVRRAREKIATADLVLLVVDASQPLQEEDLLAYQACRDCTALLVLNKSDLVSVPPDMSFCSFAQLEISAKTGQGLPALREAVGRMFSQDSGDLCDSVTITEKRHNDALLRCRESLERAVNSIAGQMSLEFIALDIRSALDALGLISGETTTDDILNDIFSSFCIGK
jgi:tRNA modification GTPase